MYKKILLFVILIAGSGQVLSQQDGIQAGSVTLFPTFGITYGHDSNIYYSHDEDTKQSSNFLIYSPGIRLEGEGEKSDLLLQYDYNKTIFTSSSENNFEMHHLLAAVGYQNSEKSRLELSAEYFTGSDRRGTHNQQGNLLNLNLKPDEWHSFGIGGKWHYGGVGAKGAIDLEVGFIDREYDNNRLYTATRDRETRYIAATYAHTVSPKTKLLAQARFTQIDYDIATLDNEEQRLMFGAEWDASGKTSARALVGFLRKEFDDPLIEDFSGLAVETGLTWRLRSYSIFDLSLNRETDETNGNGFYVVRNSADLGWTHSWRQRFTTTASVGVSSENYEGSIRDDNANYYGISASYQFSDWLNSGLGFRHYERSSTFDEFEYKDDSLMLTLEFSK
jgi:hypothetical protein